MERVKHIIKQFLPPILLNAIRASRDKKYGFFGDYKSWDDACKDCSGYNSKLILNKVRDALLKVKKGEAAYERDSVLFDHIHYSFPVLAGLLLAADGNRNQLSVLDFGGSLGSHYYQYKSLLSDLSQLTWSVVEQEEFVQCGQELFVDKYLSFYYNVDSCMKQTSPDVLLMSSVVAYVQDPYELIARMIAYKFKYIIFDRTAFTENNSDRLTLQIVPPSIYQASYPAWFLSQSKFLELFQNKYKLLVEFDGSDRVIIAANFKGFIFQKLDIY